MEEASFGNGCGDDARFSDDAEEVSVCLCVIPESACDDGKRVDADSVEGNGISVAVFLLLLSSIALLSQYLSLFVSAVS